MSLMQNVVKVVDKVTDGLGMQTIVTHKMFLADGGTGDPGYKTVKRRAVVEKKQKQVQSSSGELAMSQAVVTFVNGSVNVDAHDIIILPDGTGGQVINAASPVDKEGKLITEAYL